MGTIVLLRGTSPEEVERTAGPLAEFLRGFCDGAEQALRRQREFLACCAPLRRSRAAADQAVRIDLQDVRRAMRRVSRARGRPLPRARREIRRLVALLEGVPFESLVVSPDSVIARMGAPGPDSAGEATVAHDIALCLPPSGAFPVCVRKYTDAGVERLFIDGGRHGACRGEAIPLLESAVESLDLSGLVLVALSWARRNVL